MPHTAQHRPEKLTLQDIMDARRAGNLTTRQFTDLFGEINKLGEGGTLTSEEVAIIMGGGQIDRRGFIERTFGGITSTDPAEQGTFIRPGFDIPGTGIGVNIPLLAGGVTLASLGIGGPGTATALGLSRAGTLGAARSALPVLGGRALSLRPVLGPAAGITGGIIGSAQGGPQPPPVGAPTPPAQEVPGGGALGAEIAGGPGGGPILPTGDGDAPFEPPFTEVDVLDGDGNPTGTTVFVDATGRPVPPNAFNIPREVAETNANFLGTREGQEFLAEQKEVSRGTEFGRQLQLAGFTRRRDESIRQGDFAEAREVARRQQEAQLVNTLLPLLSRPGSRFALQANLIRSGGGDGLPGGLGGLFGGGQFSAGLSPTGGGEAQFTPTEALSRIFRFSGFQPDQDVPLTGEQTFRNIPNIQQFADLGPGQREELEAIIQQSSGRDLFSIGRQSRRLAPPR